jgi:glycosyltransferase involved in cell wall biosynthesis
MKVSVITAVLNNKDHLKDNLESVATQVYPDIEHIVVDGGSTDGTLEILRAHQDGKTTFISEPDRGIYDALNKGIRRSTGHIIGILHADDLYADDRVIERVVQVFQRRKVKSCYGDLQYVDQHRIDRVIRHWRSSPYTHGKFQYGWMPPHPTFFAKKEIYEKLKGYDPRFRIAGDYELMLRYLEIHKISTFHLPEVLVRMRHGGVSNRSLKDLATKSYEDYLAWKVNHLTFHFYTLLLKQVTKLPQFFLR